MNKNKNFLIDKFTIDLIGKILSTETGPFLEIGCGSGNITRVVPQPRVLVEPYEQYPGAIRQRIQQLRSLPLEPKILVSNLPFDQAIEILVHCLRFFPSIKKSYVIVQKQVAQKMRLSQTVLGFKMRYFFKITCLRKLKKQFFKPKPSVDAQLLCMEVVKPYDPIIFQFFGSITQPRKKLRNNIFENLVDPSLAVLLDKRLGELTQIQVDFLCQSYKKCHT